MNETEIIKAYCKFIGRNIEDFGLCSYEKIPKAFIRWCEK